MLTLLVFGKKICRIKKKNNPKLQLPRKIYATHYIQMIKIFNKHGPER